jgi:hypothetical protein
MTKEAVIGPIVIAAALSIGGALMLFGMPSALFLNMFGDIERFRGNSPEVWTAMIQISAVSPLGVAPALWLLWAVRPRAAWYWSWAAGLAGYAAGGAVAAQLV